MVDIAPRQISGINMPVDFASYLLSASPPGFDSLHQYSTLKPCVSEPVIHTSSSADRLYAQIYAAVTTNNTATVSKAESVKNDGGKKKRNGVNKKRVSFADELGKALIHVRVMSEPSNSPPVLRSISALLSMTGRSSHGASLLVGEDVSAHTVSDHIGELQLQFAQPVSSYEKFRLRLSKQNVSVENVVASNAKIAGTILVTNLGFEKAVYVRYTRDAWTSFDEVIASYTAPEKSGDPLSHRYDRFSFEAHVGTAEQCVEFCVRYLCCGTEYWDNNDGCNYAVASASVALAEAASEVASLSLPRSSSDAMTMSTTFRAGRRSSADENTIFALDFHENWSDFGWWQHSTQGVQNPYY